MIPTARRTFASLAFLALVSTPGFAQPADSPSAPPAASAAPTFEIADVHVSPHSTNTDFTGGVLHGDRYLLHNATMVNILSLAYGVDSDNILSGPPWLDLDRFDINARAPRNTSPADLKLMLQALLADRFHLVTHKDTHPMPAYVLTVGKSGPRLKEADDSAHSSCSNTPNAPATPSGAVPLIYVTCTNLTLDQIAANLHDMAGGYLDRQVFNSTGIKGSYTFDIKWTARGNLQRAGADGISIFDAVDKQLGLKLEAKTAPLPVIVVDKVDETPTPNPPGLDKALPPPPRSSLTSPSSPPASPTRRSRAASAVTRSTPPA